MELSDAWRWVVFVVVYNFIDTQALWFAMFDCQTPSPTHNPLSQAEEAEKHEPEFCVFTYCGEAERMFVQWNIAIMSQN